MNWVPLELSLRQFFHIKSLTTLNNLVIFLQHIIIHPQGILARSPSLGGTLLHSASTSCMAPALPHFSLIQPKVMHEQNLPCYVCMYPQKPIDSQRFTQYHSVLLRYVLLINYYKLHCYKYGARLRQIACFWVILKKNSCAGGRYNAPSRPHVNISCIFSNLTRQVCPKRKKLIQDWVSSTHRWRSTLSLCSNSD